MSTPIFDVLLGPSPSVGYAKKCCKPPRPVRCTGVTGVEMEALTAVSVAALTVYDMCKAVQKDMVIDRICLLKKEGGKSGLFERSDTP